MENEIIVPIIAFNLLQKVMVLNSSHNVIKQTECTMSDLNETLYILSKNYDVKNITLVGNKSFTTKLKDEIETDVATKYDYKDVKVKLIEN